MGYPNIIYADYGDEKGTFSAQPNAIPLGQLMILPDGRKFRLAQAGSAGAVTAGVIVSTTAAVTGHGAIAGSGLLACDTTTQNLVTHTAVYLLNKSVAVTKDQYSGGLLNVQLGTGNAMAYKIKGNNSGAVSTVIKFELEPSDPLVASFAAGTTACSLRKSPYKDAIAYNAGTLISGPMGITPVPVAASYFFWVARSGPTSVRTSATAVVVGQVVTCDTAIAGSATVALSTNGSTQIGYPGSVLGFALEAPTAAEAALVDLILER